MKPLYSVCPLSIGALACRPLHEPRSNRHQTPMRRSRSPCCARARERPGCSDAAEQRDELAPSILELIRINLVGAREAVDGTSSSALAVLRLSTVSYFGRCLHCESDVAIGRRLTRT